MMSAIKLSVIMVSIIMMSAIMMSVIWLSVMARQKERKRVIENFQNETKTFFSENEKLQIFLNERNKK